jgi:hypothetical protein
VEQGEELERSGAALRSYLRTELDAIDVDPLSAYLPQDQRRPSRIGGVAKWSFGLGATVVLLVGALLVGVQLRTLRSPATASATAGATATANATGSTAPTATQPPVPMALSASYGLLAMTRDGFVVRRETDPAPIRRIEPTSHSVDRTIAISRNGRFVAYWRPAAAGESFGDTLMVYDAATNADPRPALTVQGDVGGALIWADDDSGIAYTSFPFRSPSPGPPLRLAIVEMQGATAGGPARTIANFDRGKLVVPLAWIRETHSVSVVEGEGTGVATNYALADESGQGSVRRFAVSSGDQMVRLNDVVANQQSRMLAYLVTFTCQDGTPGCTLIRFWALEDPQIAVGWQATPGSTFVGLQWRPYSRDLLVRTRDDRAGLVAGGPVVRLESWSSAAYGSGRSITPLPANASELVVRPDGRSVFAATLSNGWPATLYDLTSSASFTTNLTTAGAGNPHYSVTMSDNEAQRLDSLFTASPLLTDAEVTQFVAKARTATDRVDTVKATLDSGTYPLGGRAPVWTVKVTGQFVDAFSRGLGPAPQAHCEIAKFNARSGQLFGIQFLPNESDCS